MQDQTRCRCLILHWYCTEILIVYLVTVRYSIINLLIVGKEMSDPFGTDVHNFPHALLCNELKDYVHDLYVETGDVSMSFVCHTGSNDRSQFHADNFNITIISRFNSIRTDATVVAARRIEKLPVRVYVFWCRQHGVGRRRRVCGEVAGRRLGRGTQG